jgi:hypothetical protein
LLATAGIAAAAGPLAIGIGHAPTIRAQPRVTTAVSQVGAPEASLIQAAPAQTPTPQQGAGAGSTPKPLEFDAASIKPYSGGDGGGRNGGIGGGPPLDTGGGGLRFTPGRVASAPNGVTARRMILEAFHLTQYQLSGGPGWLDTDRFALEAKAEGADENQLRQMLQTLPAERFKLVGHRETREMAVYALLVGKNGTKLHECLRDWQGRTGLHRRYRL